LSFLSPCQSNSKLRQSLFSEGIAPEKRTAYTYHLHLTLHRYPVAADWLGQSEVEVVALGSAHVASGSWSFSLGGHVGNQIFSGLLRDGVFECA
jgi:hypothetical protein